MWRHGREKDIAAWEKERCGGMGEKKTWRHEREKDGTRETEMSEKNEERKQEAERQGNRGSGKREVGRENGLDANVMRFRNTQFIYIASDRYEGLLSRASRMSEYHESNQNQGQAGHPHFVQT